MSPGLSIGHGSSTLLPDQKMKFKRLRAFRLARGRREGSLNDDSIAGLRDTRYKISCRSLYRFWVGLVGECLRRDLIHETRRRSSGDGRGVDGMGEWCLVGRMVE